MSFILTDNNDNKVKYIISAFTDTRAEVATAPTNFTPGSVLCAIDDGSVWVLNEEHVWLELMPDNSGGA